MKKFGARLILCCVVALISPYFSLDYNGTAEAKVEFREGSIEFLLATEQSTVPESEMKDDIANSYFLGDECPVPLDEKVWSDSDCLEAIDSHFIDKPAYVVNFPGMISRGGWFTYRDMFEQHANDRKLVAEALANPECRLLEGPMRLNLRDTCNADAFSRYARMANLCYFATTNNWFKPDDFFRGKSRYQQNLNGMEDFDSYRERRYDDLEKYYSWRNALRKSALLDVWLESSNKCKTDFLSPHEELSAQEPQRLLHYDLEEIAARLGDERMLFASQGSTGWYGDKHYQRSKYKLHAWQNQIHTAIGGIGTLISTAKRPDAIASAAWGIVGMRKAGYEADLERIVSKLCQSRSLQDEEDVKECSTAYQHARSLVDPTEMDVFRALDEIKETALGLGLFQVP
ncbi:MAG: hypothetical protein OXG24_14205 [Gammaproteobacteria bacterium]|nr:hypothetical protein [Gammaproteobacteria bacterium]